MFWEEIKGADGIVRQLQWTARVEGSFDTPNGSTFFPPFPYGKLPGC